MKGGGPPPPHSWTSASASTESAGVESCRLPNITGFQHRSCICAWLCTTPRWESNGPPPSPSRA
eukprot:775681-Pyramimonas_sp.AAC.1